MKKVLLSIIMGLTSFAYANVNAVVSILPQQTFLKKIGGDKVNIALMVKPGSSPHSYEPKPSQMKSISQADIYFTIGVEFEHNWLDKFTHQNKNMIISNMGENIVKFDMEEHSHHDHEEELHDKHEEKGHDDHAKENHEKHHDDDHDEDSKDPHIWTTPANVKTIAYNIFNELSLIDKTNKDYYRKNLETFIKEIDQTDKKIKELLKETAKNSKFMVFHPAWGYFAHEYGLTQLAIESGGKNPKPKQIAFLIEEAKEENVKAVFTAPEFSTNTANQIAQEVGVPVIKVSPLNPKWSENLIGLAKAISGK